MKHSGESIRCIWKYLVPQQVMVDGWKWLPDPCFWNPSEKKNLNNNNETVLYYAATNGIVSALEVLLQNKANLEIEDKHSEQY